ncbi:hypothetical protein [Streptomyces sp. ST1020]|uniref:hypothetical protein n=1 Tax=Streptomyces sp. ST1020 TaxID=1848901 RepID=UPI0034C5D88E
MPGQQHEPPGRGVGGQGAVQVLPYGVVEAAGARRDALLDDVRVEFGRGRPPVGRAVPGGEYVGEAGEPVEVAGDAVAQVREVRGVASEVQDDADVRDGLGVRGAASGRVEEQVDGAGGGVRGRR